MRKAVLLVLLLALVAVGLTQLFPTLGLDAYLPTSAFLTRPAPVETPTPLTVAVAGAANGWLADAGCPTLSGWASDPANPAAPVAVHVYLDGPYGSGEWIGSTTADQPIDADACQLLGGRDCDVCPADEPQCRHGFTFTLPAHLYDERPHTLYLYMDSGGAGGGSAQLAGSPRPIACHQPTATPTVKPTAVRVVVIPTATPEPREATPVADADWLGYVNAYRAIAGVPSVAEDNTLSRYCGEHARYMALNKGWTHQQTASLAGASHTGQICAQNGNVWVGWTGTPRAGAYSPRDAVDFWLGSVSHRLWLLYPTTPAFGFGFNYNANTGYSAAALDIYSLAAFDDSRFSGWPVRYPAAHQANVPTTASGKPYPITVQWPDSGPSPHISLTSLSTGSGTGIAHTISTSLPTGHKGVLIQPTESLPDNTVFLVTVNGTYNGQPFNLSWKFSTGPMTP